MVSTDHSISIYSLFDEVVAGLVLSKSGWYDLILHHKCHSLWCTLSKIVLFLICGFLQFWRTVWTRGNGFRVSSTCVPSFIEITKFLLKLLVARTEGVLLSWNKWFNAKKLDSRSNEFPGPSDFIQTRTLMDMYAHSHMYALMYASIVSRHIYTAANVHF